LTNTAVTSAVMNFWCHKLIAKLNKEKNIDMKNLFLINVGKLVILNSEYIKICGRTTKLQAIKIQFLCIFFHIC